MTSPLPKQPATAAIPEQEGMYISRKASPSGMGDSIASLPAMPSKSVPGTPFGVGNGMGGARRSGTSPGLGGEGMSYGQRGYSNPDLARTFGKIGGGFSMNEPPRVSRSLTDVEQLADIQQAYGGDPIYGGAMFTPVSAPLPPSAAVAAAFTPQSVPYDPYGFADDDGYGSGALYPGGAIGLKNKRADHERECRFRCPVTKTFTHFVKSTASAASVSRIYKGNYFPCARISTAAGTYRRNSKMATQLTVT